MAVAVCLAGRRRWCALKRPRSATTGPWLRADKPTVLESASAASIAASRPRKMGRATQTRTARDAGQSRDARVVAPVGPAQRGL
jgi:hypothetical protein